LAQRGRDLGDERDAVVQTSWRQVQGFVEAHRGNHPAAEALLRETVVIAKRTDALELQGEALCDLAEVLRLAGRSDAAASTLAQALERYERKNNLTMAAQVRDRLAEFNEAAPR
jgi:Tetratricopeptide repeat